MRDFDSLYRKHKMRLDRGRMWYSLFQAIITAFLVVVFGSDSNLFTKILAAFLSFVIIYLLGTVDDWLKLVDRDQKQLAIRNPFLDEVMTELKKQTELIEKLHKDEKV